MTTLLDTSAVIGLIERRDPAVLELVRQLEGPSVRSMFVYGELLHGLAQRGPGIAERRRTVEHYEKITDSFAAALDPGLLASRYAEVSASASNGLIRLGQNDRWIIAEASLIGIDVFVTQDSTQSRLAAMWFEESGLEIAVLTDA